LSAEELIRPKARILLIEDEEKLAETLADYLGMNEYQVVCAFTGDRGLELFYDRMHELDLILLDIMLPDISGTEILKEIRKRSRVPVIMVTARDSVRDQLQNFENGADDYLTKPFRIGELRARIHAHLRREHREKHSTLNLDKIRIDLSAKTICVEDQPVRFTKSEYQICQYLAMNRGQVFSKEQIYEKVFSFSGESDSSTISTHVKNIRAKFQKLGVQPIATVWGIGYKWEQ